MQDKLLSDIVFVSFAKNEEEIISVLIALRSLKAIKIAVQKPMVLVPKNMVIAFDESYPDLGLEKLVKGLNAKLVTPFPGGYNENIGFRAVIKNVERRIKNAPMIFFAPKTIFRNPDLNALTAHPVSFARAEDAVWPDLSLYDPSLEKFWRLMAEYSGVELTPWLDETQPKNYWRRYPNFTNQLYYIQDVSGFATLFEEISASLQKETPRFLEGMGPHFTDAALAMTAMRLGAAAVDIGWNDQVFGYHDVYDLVLRMGDAHYEWMSSNVLRSNDLRGMLKSFDEYRVIFFQNRLRKLRESFDDIERGFTTKRMQLLISNRKLRNRVRQAVRKQQEAGLVIDHPDAAGQAER